MSVSLFSVRHHSKSSYINSQDRNVEWFTSVSFLSEFLSTGGIDPTAHFEPTNFYGILFLSFFLSNKFYLVFSSKLQLLSIIIYLIFIIYLMCNGIHSLFKLKFNYSRQFWSYILNSAYSFVCEQMSEFIFGDIKNINE